MLRCFGDCAEYILDRNDFNKCFDGDLVYFEDGDVGIEAQGLGEFDILDGSLWLRGGAYGVEVLYESVSNYENASTDFCGGKIVFDTYNASIL